MIKKVQEFEIGQKYLIYNIPFIIAKFPTRNSVVLHRIKPVSGEITMEKMSITKLREYLKIVKIQKKYREEKHNEKTQ